MLSEIDGNSKNYSLFQPIHNSLKKNYETEKHRNKPLAPMDPHPSPSWFPANIT